MASHYLQMDDGIIVEVGSPGDRRQEMHESALEQVDAKIESAGNLIEKVVRKIGASFIHMHEALDVPIEVESAEVEMGLSFSAEGWIFITKAKAEGSLSIKIVFTPFKKSKQHAARP
jgi:Trypsin-co-occurring domain 1